MFTDASFGANQKDLQECASSEPDRSIAGCTRLLADRSETTGLMSRPTHERATAWLAKGDLDRAIADCNEAIRLDPKSVSAYGYRGLAWRQKGDFARAIADYTTAIRLDPNNATLRTNRGLAYFAKGDFSAALTNLRPRIKSKNYAYLILFQYLARTRAGETATAELATSAALLKSKESPFAAIELHFGQPVSRSDARRRGRRKRPLRGAVLCRRMAPAARRPRERQVGAANRGRHLP